MHLSDRTSTLDYKYCPGDLHHGLITSELSASRPVNRDHTNHERWQKRKKGKKTERAEVEIAWGVPTLLPIQSVL